MSTLMTREARMRDKAAAVLEQSKVNRATAINALETEINAQVAALPNILATTHTASVQASMASTEASYTDRKTAADAAVTAADAALSAAGGAL